MLTNRENEVLEFIKNNPSRSSKEIHEGLKLDMSYATAKRTLSTLLTSQLVISEGKGRGTKYLLSASYQLFHDIDVQNYFEKEIDEREIFKNFNFSLIREVLESIRLFTKVELEHLESLQQKFKKNSTELNANEFAKEMERLAIDLSWKSSQIEGNTYSLLETERLLKDKETAAGKTKDDATMLLNHKEAIDFIVENPDYITSLSLRAIEDIHSILIKELGVERNVRRRRIGISGTNYRPLANEHQIRESMKAMCELINSRKSVFEKSLLSLVLISYIQAFADGNKRTARIISNAILISNQYCPISFRTIDSVEYKKAMLIFYEQNNISAFKSIFIDQFEFAVNTYF